jgi:hypothetical protein
MVYLPSIELSYIPRDFALLIFRFESKLYPVDYRGIRYTLRARIEREQWYVAIYPAGVEMKGRVVIGSREEAELQAHALIDSWLKRQSTQKPKRTDGVSSTDQGGGKRRLGMLRALSATPAAWRY